MLIYKILSRAEWQQIEQSGSFAGSAVDLADGFIHFSTAAQAAETAAKHFAGQTDLMVFAVEADGMDAMKWEPSRGGALFPHLYRPLLRTEVLWAAPLPLGPNGHEFPKDMA